MAPLLVDRRLHEASSVGRIAKVAMARIERITPRGEDDDPDLVRPSSRPMYSASSAVTKGTAEMTIR